MTTEEKIKETLDKIQTLESQMMKLRREADWERKHLRLLEKQHEEEKQDKSSVTDLLEIAKGKII